MAVPLGHYRQLSPRVGMSALLAKVDAPGRLGRGAISSQGLAATHAILSSPISDANSEWR
jgi:hypothetical protein